MHRYYTHVEVKRLLYSTASKVIDTKEKKEYDRETGVKKVKILRLYYSKRFVFIMKSCTARKISVF